MLTPFFTVDQDDEFVLIDVKISHVRFSAQNIEMVVENELFIFSLPPYYLRIRLPFPCIDDERSHAHFDSKEESVKIKIPKLTKGQHFPNLDLTAKLLARTSNIDSNTEQPRTQKPLIEEIDVNNNVSDNRVPEVLDEGEQFNWEISQTEHKDQLVDGDVTLTNIRYGFNNQYETIVGVSMSNGNDINEMGDPETTPTNDRIIERLIKENIKFDPEYYAADYILEKYPMPDDDKIYKPLLEWKSPSTKSFMSWYKKQQELPESERQQIMPIEFSKDEQEKMIQLPRKSYLIEDAYKPQLFILILSLLFSYQYDLRENEGEHTIESAWTVGKLTPQIVFLDSQIVVDNQDNLIRAALITSIRRALSYPYHRNFNLCIKALDDVYYNLRGGKRIVLKSLLAVKELFRYHDVYYVYDKIWMEDLCTWLISDEVTEGMIRNLAHDMRKVYTQLKKTDITFEKLDDSAMEHDAGEETNEDESQDMIALNLQEIEEMAEQQYQQYQQQS